MMWIVPTNYQARERDEGQRSDKPPKRQTTWIPSQRQACPSIRLGSMAFPVLPSVAQSRPARAI